MNVSRKIKRALSESDRELSPEVEELVNKVAQLFVAGRFADVYGMGTPALQQAIRRDRFVTNWGDAVSEYRPLTGFRIADMGQIDLGFIPSLEEVPQEQFVAFVEISFSGVDVAFDDEKALTVGVILLAQDRLRIGALHKR